MPKVNGRIIPLNKPLKTGDQVEILTSKEEAPRRDWLNSNYGFVTTSRARAKVAHWFKLQAKEQNAEAGRDIILREFRRLALDPQAIDLNRIAHAVNYKTAEDLCAALGAGDLRLSQIIHEAQRQVEPERSQPQMDLALASGRSAQEPRKGGSGINIQGVGNLLTTLATCCKPVPGDPIMGYITQGRGISIHHEDCLNLMSLRENEPDRVISVDWGDENEQTYPVDIMIEAFDRPGLLRDVMLVLSNEKLNILAANTLTDRKNNMARLTLTVEIPRLERLGRLMDKINQVPNVLDVHRERSGAH